MPYQYCAWILLISFLSACQSEQRSDSGYTRSPVKTAGAMRNVMMKGQLESYIKLDTIRNKVHLYGIGPASRLSGEITVVDGNAYVATVVTDSSMAVTETFQAEAPFFVYANVNDWFTGDLPDSVTSMKQLEHYLDGISIQREEPFVFKLSGRVVSADIHVVNLPPGVSVRSHEDAHQGQRNFNIAGEEVVIVGFYSRKHKGFFTHHAQHTHMHLITLDKTKMGHVDDFLLSSPVKIYIAR